MIKLLVSMLLLSSLVFTVNSFAKDQKDRRADIKAEMEKKKQEREADRKEFKQKMLVCEEKIYAVKKKMIEAADDAAKDALKGEMDSARDCRKQLQISGFKKRIQITEENLVKMKQRLSDIEKGEMPE